jgi:hypothetical protein
MIIAFAPVWIGCSGGNAAPFAKLPRRIVVLQEKATIRRGQWDDLQLQRIVRRAGLPMYANFVIKEADGNET